MRLHEYLDKGASLGASAPCLTMHGRKLRYGEVVSMSHRIACALRNDGVRAGEHVAVLSANDALAFACVFGISRAGAVWCPLGARDSMEDERVRLEAFDCVCLIYQHRYERVVDELRARLPKLRVAVCLETLDIWLAECPDDPVDVAPASDIAMLASTGGSTGRVHGVMLTERNLETMSALTLMRYPFRGRPVYLAATPLGHSAGVLTFPVLTLGGEIVVMPNADAGELLHAIERARVTHLFLPPTLIYALLAHPSCDDTDFSSLQCIFYGGSKMSAARLVEAIGRIGPVFGQLFGQTEAPMMISTLAPSEHFHDDGTIATERIASAGRPSPLCTVAIMNESGERLPASEHGEIVVRSSLVMAGYYKDAAATEDTRQHGWHHTGDVGFLDEEGYLHITDRKRDLILSGGYKIYSGEVEQALMEHPAVHECGVVGLPDEARGESVIAVVTLEEGAHVLPEELRSFVRSRIGPSKAPKRIELWRELPHNKMGKLMKREIRARLLATA